MDNDEVFILAALGIICASIVCVSLLRLARSYLEARAQRPASEFPRNVEERLQTIQATVEATAIEVERVAEANRYLTRVLSEGPAKRTIAPDSRTLE